MKRSILHIFGGGVLTLAFGAANAATVTVPYPYIDVVQQGGDAGVTATGSTPTVTMQGSAVAIVTGPGANTSLSPTANFTLTATYEGLDPTTPSSYDYGNGTLTIGSASNPLLTATFSDLVMTSSGTSSFSVVIASSPLTYTGGSLAGALPGGEIVGSFTVNPGSFSNNALGNADLSKDYAGSNLTAKVGAVVPLPDSFGLLLAGVVGLALIVRQRRPSLTAVV